MRELMESHRELCERATHPLEIAAGLEASGVGPAAVARCRHADVFSLAEELYARVPRRADPLGPPSPSGPWRRRAGAGLLAALLYALPCAAFAGIRAVAPGSSPWALLAAAAVAGLWYAATFLETARWQGGRSHGDPSADRPALRVIAAAGIGAVLTVPLLLPFAGAGDPVPPVAPAALAVGMGAAEWSARWFRHCGQIHLDCATTVHEFRLRMLPVLPMAVALHLAAVAGLTWAVLAVRAPGGGAGAPFGALPWAAQGAAALLLVVALLLLRCGRPGPAAAGLAVAVCGVGLLTAVRELPLAVPGRSLLVSQDPVTVQLVGCGAAAALLLPYAWVLLTRPGPHRGVPPTPPSTPAQPGLPAGAPLTEGPTPS